MIHPDIYSTPAYTSIVRFVRTSVLALMIASGTGVAASADTQSSLHPSVALGHSLRKALDSYAALGLNIVSSSRVVPRKLKVISLPDAALPVRAQAQVLLAAHGLQLVMVDAQNGYVVHTPRAQDEAGSANPTTTQSQTAADVIEEVVVTSHYRVRRQSDLTYDIDHQDLITTPSLGRDVLRSLETLPGIASSGVSARHQFRGGDSNEVLYRLDGVELLEPFHLPDIYDLFSAINLNIVESMDVYVAGFPVNLGSRMSGVVDLSLVEPSLPLTGHIDVNLINAAADVSGWRGPWSWVASARHGVADQFMQYLETDFGEPNFQDGFVQLAHESAEQRISVNLLNSRDRISLIDAPEQGRTYNDYRAVWGHLERSISDTLNTSLTLQHLVIEHDRIGRIDDPDFSVGTMQSQQDFRNTELANHWQWRPSTQWSFDAGWSYAYQSADFFNTFDVNYGPIALPIQGRSSLRRTTDVKRSGESVQAYLSVTHQLTQRLEMQTGIRFDGQDIDPVHVNEVSARFNLAWELHPQLTLALNVGRYTQQQHLYEIQIDDGKAELDAPEHSDQVNLTALYAPHPDLRLRLDLYHRHIDNAWSHYENLYNRWVLFPELQGDRFEIAPSEVTADGIEWTLTHSPSRVLNWYLNYSFSRARERYLGKLRNRPWAQQHSAKAGLRWQGAQWRLGLNASYHTGWPTSTLIVTPAQLEQAVFDESLPDFVSLDAHLARRFVIPRGEFEVYLDVMNLSGRANVGGYEYDVAGTRKRKSLLPLMPILGVLWRW